jgi:hypothetical protein
MTVRNIPVLVQADQLVAEDEDETLCLRQMHQDARTYLSSFSWCLGIQEARFGGGLGKVFAIFLFRIDARPGIDSWIWVVVGDIPFAYLPLEDCGSPLGAFELYLDGMTKWIGLARQGKEGKPEDGVPPVNLPATPEWAEKLSVRLEALNQIMRPFFEN